MNTTKIGCYSLSMPGVYAPILRIWKFFSVQDEMCFVLFSIQRFLATLHPAYHLSPVCSMISLHLKQTYHLHPFANNIFNRACQIPVSKTDLNQSICNTRIDPFCKVQLILVPSISLKSTPL